MSPIRRVLALLLVAAPALAQEGSYRAGAEIVLDVSQAMGAKEGDSTLLALAIGGIEKAVAEPALKDAEITLRTMGGTSSGRAKCEATQVVAPAGISAGPVLETLRARQVATGPRPLTAALEGAVADLPQSPGSMRAIIIVTAGADSCGRDACEAATELRHTLGLGRVRVVSLGAASGGLACLGEVVKAKTVDEIAARVGEVLDATFNPATLTVTATDKSKPAEADVEVYVAGDDVPLLRARAGSPLSLAGGRYHVRVATNDDPLAREGWRRDVELAAGTKIALRVALAGEPAKLLARVRLNGQDAPEGTRLYVHHPGQDEDPVADGWPNEELRVLPGLYDVRAQIPATGLGSIDVWKPDVKLVPGETTKVTLDARQKLGALRVRVKSGAEELEEADVLVLPDKSRELGGSTIAQNDLVPVPSGTYTVGVHYETPGGVLQAWKDGVVVGTEEVPVTLDVGPTARIVVEIEGADETAGITVGLARKKGETPLGYMDSFMEHRVPAGTWDLRLEEPTPAGARVFWARGVVIPAGERKVIPIRRPKPKDH